MNANALNSIARPNPIPAAAGFALRAGVVGLTAIGVITAGLYFWPSEDEKLDYQQLANLISSQRDPEKNDQKPNSVDFADAKINSHTSSEAERIIQAIRDIEMPEVTRQLTTLSNLPQQESISREFTVFDRVSNSIGIVVTGRNYQPTDLKNHVSAYCYFRSKYSESEASPNDLYLYTDGKRHKITNADMYKVGISADQLAEARQNCHPDASSKPGRQAVNPTNNKLRSGNTNVGNGSDTNRIAHFTGDFDSNLLKDVESAIRDGAKQFSFNSPGGQVGYGVRIADLIWQAGGSTLIREGEYCNSACAIAFLGGQSRTVAGNIGVHRWKEVNDPFTTASLQQKIAAEYARIVARAKVNAEFLELNWSVPHSRIYSLTPAQIVDWNIDTSRRRKLG